MNMNVLTLIVSLNIHLLSKVNAQTHPRATITTPLPALCVNENIDRSYLREGKNRHRLEELARCQISNNSVRLRSSPRSIVAPEFQPLIVAFHRVSHSTCFSFHATSTSKSFPEALPSMTVSSVSMTPASDVMCEVSSSFRSSNPSNGSSSSNPSRFSPFVLVSQHIRCGSNIIPPTTWTPLIDPLVMLLINAGLGGVKTSRGVIESNSRRISSLPSHRWVRGLYV